MPWCRMACTLRSVSIQPHAVHELRSGVYDDRKDTVVRDLDGRREELDGVAAR